MADFEHCFGCRHSVYVVNNSHRIPNNDKICLFCFKEHKFLKKNALSNLLCFEHEDKNNPSHHTANEAEEFLANHQGPNGDLMVTQ